MDIFLERALIAHFAAAALAFWPALKLLRRAGLPAAWAGTLVVPLLGWPLFTSLVALRTWPALPPKPEKLHPRERMRRERERAAARTEGT